jgi:hypothetical protein
MAAPETTGLHVFHIGKRTGYFVHWEPIFIGTHSDPLYDERLSWEGKSDKMTQVRTSHSSSESTARFALLLVYESVCPSEKIIGKVSEFQCNFWPEDPR